MTVTLAVTLIVSIAFNYYQKRKLNKTLHLLALQNQNIMLAIRTGNIAVWGYDVKRGHLYNIEGEVFPGDKGATIAEAMAGVHPDDCGRFAEILQGVVGGKMPDEAICIRFKNMYTDEWEYVEKEFAIIKSPEGEVETVIGTHKDVTKRVLEAERVDELLKKYQHLCNENQTMLNTLPTGVSIYDNQGRMIYVNQTMCRMFGIKDRDQFLQAKAVLWDNPLVDDQIKAKIRKGENTSFNYQMDRNKLPATYFHPSDKIVYVSCISSVVKNECSEIESYVFIHRDITLQEIQEADMKDMSETLMRVIDASGFSVWEYPIKEQKFYSYRGDLCVEDGTTYQDTLAKHTPKSAQRCDAAFYNLTHGITEIEHAMFELIDPESGKSQFYKSELVARKDADDRITKIYGIQKEVTDEYNYQLELEESRLKTQLAIQVSDMVLWEYDVTKRLFYTLNEKCESETLTFEDYYRVTHPDDLQKIYKKKELMDSKCNESFEFDTRFKFPLVDQWQHIRITGTPLKLDQNGEVVKYTGFQRNNTQWYNDISDRKRLYEELELSRNEALSANQLLREILSRIPGAIFIKDTNDDFRYVMANSVFGEIWGISEDEIVGKSDFEVMDDELAAVYRKDDERVIAEGKPVIVEEETYNDGAYCCWKTIKSTFTSINNRKLLIGMSVDITEIRTANDELKKAKNKAEESDKLKSAFLANMSHEIRTPLNSIVGFSELLKDSDNQMDKDEFWNIISTNNELLLRLISDILDLSKIDAGALELKSVEFDLAGRFNDIYSMLKLRHMNQEVEFVCDHPYSGCIVALDESRITQIITNFVTNAFKFTPKGQVKMGYEYVENGIRLYCIDTGIGIAPEKMSKIFTRFSKLNDFAQGTGLGTAICKAIVDAYGGKIGANSVVDEGSTFWAWIPCEAMITHDDTGRC